MLTYWDACLFLDYLNASPEGVEIVSPLVASARLGDIDIVTSTISIAEVAYVTRELAQGPDPRVESGIDSMFRDVSLLTLVEYDQEIGAAARGLIRRTLQRSKRIKPMDAIHLATAMSVGAEIFYTFDDSLLGHARLLTTVPAARPQAPEAGSWQGKLIE